MGITGAHVLLYTSEPEQLRAVFRDVLGFRFVDDGEGWLIFALPPAELGVHPAEPGDNKVEFSLMVDDIASTVAALADKDMTFANEPHDRGYGIACEMHVPGGRLLGFYEPRHKTAI